MDPPRTRTITYEVQYPRKNRKHRKRSQNYEHFRGDPDLIRYNSKVNTKTPDSEDKLYVYKPASEAKAKPKPPQEDDDIFVYVPPVRSKSAPRRSHLPVQARVVTTEPKTVWVGRTKAEVEEDNAVLAERRGLRTTKESPSNSLTPNLWLGRTKEEIAEDNAFRAKRCSMPSPPKIKERPKYTDDDLVWVDNGDAQLSLHSFATVKHLNGAWKHDLDGVWYFAMD
ncbi:hypothetical protein AMS68_007633 [Peltaster fructicola]|uniref:Uncharacterized protein n=1 Tax=Peltaster fructicola TaxID=286661 RepID=A0A6H0Y577_9PEZI|nr:hypothetical protein AMS68_007633 [Peltaster fructicola]